MPKGLFERLQDEIEAREQRGGIGLADLLTLPENLRGLIQQVMRRGQVSAAELVQEFDISEKAVEPLLQSLVEKGYLARVPEMTPPRYKVALGRRRARQIPTGLWSALAGKVEEEG
jgi:predicted HTH transcriptional regulator